MNQVQAGSKGFKNVIVVVSYPGRKEGYPSWAKHGSEGEGKLVSFRLLSYARCWLLLGRWRPLHSALAGVSSAMTTS